MQVPTNWQVSQLLTPQLVHCLVASTKNPGEQSAHSVAALQLSQLLTEQGSQLVDPFEFKVKPSMHSEQLLLAYLQCRQLLMLQLKH